MARLLVLVLLCCASPAFAAMFGTQYQHHFQDPNYAPDWMDWQNFTATPAEGGCAPVLAYMATQGSTGTCTAISPGIFQGNLTLSGGQQMRWITRWCTGDDCSSLMAEPADVDPPDEPASGADATAVAFDQQSGVTLAYGLVVVIFAIGYVGGRLR